VYYKQVLLELHFLGFLRFPFPWRIGKQPLKKVPTQAHLRFYVALSSRLPNRDSRGVPLALTSIKLIFMIFKFNFLVYCTQQVVLDLCFHMTNATSNIFSICENFHHIVLLNTFQFSDVSIISKRMTNIGSTVKVQKKTLELVIQRKERQGLL